MYVYTYWFSIGIVDFNFQKYGLIYSKWFCRTFIGTWLREPGSGNRWTAACFGPLVCCRWGGAVRHIRRNYCGDFTRSANVSFLEEETGRRERSYRCYVVADEQYRAVVAGHLAHLSQALLLELCIANCEYLIDD